MKKLRHLVITLSISLVLSATSYAGDMHSDSLRPLPTPTPVQLDAAPDAGAPPDSNTADAASADYSDFTVDALYILLSIVQVV